MEPNAHLQSIQPSAAALAATARRDLHVEVPSCPGWQMADLVWHTGLALHEAAAALPSQAGVTDEMGHQIPEAPDDAGLVDWLEEGADRLVAAFLTLDPDDTVGRPFTDQGYPGPSLHRHYAREVGVHRWDAQAAHGPPEPIPDDLGGDWLDGVLTTWLPTAAGGGRQALGPWAGESLCLEDSTGRHRWIVDLEGPGCVTCTRQTGPVDVTVRGGGGTLLLLVLNRVAATSPGLEVEGDVRILERWVGDIRYGRPASGAHWFGSQRPTAGRGTPP